LLLYQTNAYVHLGPAKVLIVNLTKYGTVAI